MKKLNSKLPPIHPGEILKEEFLEPTPAPNWRITRLNVADKTIAKLTNHRAKAAPIDKPGQRRYNVATKAERCSNG